MVDMVLKKFCVCTRLIVFSVAFSAKVFSVKKRKQVTIQCPISSTYVYGGQTHSNTNPYTMPNLYSHHVPN